MRRYYSNDDYDESDDYDSPPPSRSSHPSRSARPAHDSEEQNLRIARGAQLGRSSGGTHSGRRNYKSCDDGYPPSRSSRPPPSSGGCREAYDDYGEQSLSRQMNRMDFEDPRSLPRRDYDDSRHPPSRSRPNQRSDRGSGCGRRDPQSSHPREQELLIDPCPNGIHTGLENHIVENDRGITYWESQRHAEIMAQCAEQCEGMPREDRHIWCIRPGVWELLYCAGEGCTGWRCEAERRGEDRRLGAGGACRMDDRPEVWFS